MSSAVADGGSSEFMSMLDDIIGSAPQDGLGFLDAPVDFAGFDDGDIAMNHDDGASDSAALGDVNSAAATGSQHTSAVGSDSPLSRLLEADAASDLDDLMLDDDLKGVFDPWAAEDVPMDGTSGDLRGLFFSDPDMLPEGLLSEAEVVEFAGLAAQVSLARAACEEHSRLIRLPPHHVSGDAEATVRTAMREARQAAEDLLANSEALPMTVEGLAQLRECHVRMKEAVLRQKTAIKQYAHTHPTCVRRTVVEHSQFTNSLPQDFGHQDGKGKNDKKVLPSVAVATRPKAAARAPPKLLLKAEPRRRASSTAPPVLPQPLGSCVGCDKNGKIWKPPSTGRKKPNLPGERVDPTLNEAIKAGCVHLDRLYTMMCASWKTLRGPQKKKHRPVRLLRAILHAVVKPKVPRGKANTDVRKQLKADLRNRVTISNAMDRIREVYGEPRPGHALRMLLAAAGYTCPPEAVRLLNDSGEAGSLADIIGHGEQSLCCQFCGKLQTYRLCRPAICPVRNGSGQAVEFGAQASKDAAAHRAAMKVAREQAARGLGPGGIAPLPASPAPSDTSDTISDADSDGRVGRFAPVNYTASKLPIASTSTSRIVTRSNKRKRGADAEAAMLFDDDTDLDADATSIAKHLTRGRAVRARRTQELQVVAARDGAGGGQVLRWAPDTQLLCFTARGHVSGATVAVQLELPDQSSSSWSPVAIARVQNDSISSDSKLVLDVVASNVPPPPLTADQDSVDVFVRLSSSSQSFRFRVVHSGKAPRPAVANPGDGRSDDSLSEDGDEGRGSGSGSGGGRGDAGDGGDGGAHGNDASGPGAGGGGSFMGGSGGNGGQVDSLDGSFQPGMFHSLGTIMSIADYEATSTAHPAVAKLWRVLNELEHTVSTAASLQVSILVPPMAESVFAVALARSMLHITRRGREQAQLRRAGRVGAGAASPAVIATTSRIVAPLAFRTVVGAVSAALHRVKNLTKVVREQSEQVLAVSSPTMILRLQLPYQLLASSSHPQVRVATTTLPAWAKHARRHVDQARKLHAVVLRTTTQILVPTATDLRSAMQRAMAAQQAQAGAGAGAGAGRGETAPVDPNLMRVYEQSASQLHELSQNMRQVAHVVSSHRALRLVCWGAAGSGKSSLLNCLLHAPTLLPFNLTKVLRAKGRSPAVVIEVVSRRSKAVHLLAGLGSKPTLSKTLSDDATGVSTRDVGKLLSKVRDARVTYLRIDWPLPSLSPLMSVVEVCNLNTPQRKRLSKLLSVQQPAVISMVVRRDATAGPQGIDACPIVVVNTAARALRGSSGDSTAAAVLVADLERVHLADPSSIARQLNLPSSTFVMSLAATSHFIAHGKDAGAQFTNLQDHICRIVADFMAPQLHQCCVRAENLLVTIVRVTTVPRAHNLAVDGQQLLRKECAAITTRLAQRRQHVINSLTTSVAHYGDTWKEQIVAQLDEDLAIEVDSDTSRADVWRRAEMMLGQRTATLAGSCAQAEFMVPFTEFRNTSAQLLDAASPGLQSPPLAQYTSTLSRAVRTVPNRLARRWKAGGSRQAVVAGQGSGAGQEEASGGAQTYGVAGVATAVIDAMSSLLQLARSGTTSTEGAEVSRMSRQDTLKALVAQTFDSLLEAVPELASSLVDAAQADIVQVTNHMCGMLEPVIARYPHRNLTRSFKTCDLLAHTIVLRDRVAVVPAPLLFSHVTGLEEGASLHAGKYNGQKAAVWSMPADFDSMSCWRAAIRTIHALVVCDHLSIPRICGVLLPNNDIEAAIGHPCKLSLVIQPVPVGSLRQHLAMARSPVFTTTPGSVLATARAIAGGLAAMHECGITHGGLSLDTVVLSSIHTGPLMCMFGPNAAPHSMNSAMAADLASFGGLMYEMLTGTPPPAEAPRQLLQHGEHATAQEASAQLSLLRPEVQTRSMVQVLQLAVTLIYPHSPTDAAPEPLLASDVCEDLADIFTSMAPTPVVMNDKLVADHTPPQESPVVVELPAQEADVDMEVEGSPPANVGLDFFQPGRERLAHDNTTPTREPAGAGRPTVEVILEPQAPKPPAAASRGGDVPKPLTNVAQEAARATRSPIVASSTGATVYPMP